MLTEPGSYAVIYYREKPDRPEGGERFDMLAHASLRGTDPRSVCARFAELVATGQPRTNTTLRYRATGAYWANFHVQDGDTLVAWAYGPNRKPAMYRYADVNGSLKLIQLDCYNGVVRFVEYVREVEAAIEEARRRENRRGMTAGGRNRRGWSIVHGEMDRLVATCWRLHLLCVQHHLCPAGVLPEDDPFRLRFVRQLQLASEFLGTVQLPRVLLEELQTSIGDCATCALVFEEYSHAPTGRTVRVPIYDTPPRYASAGVSPGAEGES